MREDIDRSKWEAAWQRRRRAWLWCRGTKPGRLVWLLWDAGDIDDDDTSADVLDELTGQGFLPQQKETDDEH